MRDTRSESKTRKRRAADQPNSFGTVVQTGSVGLAQLDPTHIDRSAVGVVSRSVGTQNAENTDWSAVRAPSMPGLGPWGGGFWGSGVLGKASSVDSPRWDAGSRLLVCKAQGRFGLPLPFPFRTKHPGACAGLGCFGRPGSRGGPPPPPPLPSLPPGSLPPKRKSAHPVNHSTSRPSGGSKSGPP